MLHGSQVGDKEVENLLRRNPCSGYKLKKVTSSGIFVGDTKDGTSKFNNANPINKIGVCIYQQALNGMSHISFNAEESIFPKKPTSLPEVAKQRELNGTLASELEPRIKKQISNAKD